MQNNTIEELIQLKQEGKIGWCELPICSGATTTASSPTTTTLSSTSKRLRAVSMTEATTLQRSLQRRSYNLSPEMQ